MTIKSNTLQKKFHYKKKQLKCYITSSNWNKVAKVQKLLEERGIKSILLSDSSYTGIYLTKKLDRVISECDFLLAILDEEKSNDNVLYEIGFAHAKGKIFYLLHLHH